MSDDNAIYIGDLSSLVDRSIATIREWDRDQVLPRELRPRRDSRGRRYWVRSQIAPLRAWIASRQVVPGGGEITDAQVQRVLDANRRKRDDIHKVKTDIGRFSADVREERAKDRMRVDKLERRIARIEKEVGLDVD